MSGASDMMMMSGLKTMIRFTGDNYRAWAYVCGLVLEEAGVRYTIEGEEEEELEQSGSKQQPSLQVSSNKQLVKKEDEEWKKDRAKAMRIIASSLSQEILEMIIGEKDPAVVWKMLKSQYESNSLQMQLHLQTMLNELKMKEGEDFNEFYGRVRQMREQLKGTGSTITDMQLISYILRAMPKGYEGTKEYIVNVGSLSLSDVVAKLGAKSEMMKLEKLKGMSSNSTEFNGEDDGGEMAAYANGNHHRSDRGGMMRGGYRGRGGVEMDSSFSHGRGGSIHHRGRGGTGMNDRGESHRCFNCGQFGHRSYECEEKNPRCRWCRHPYPNHPEDQCYYKEEQEEESYEERGRKERGFMAVEKEKKKKEEGSFTAY
jgi:hypothetical protein